MQTDPWTNGRRWTLSNAVHDRADEHGSIAAFVVVLTGALLLCGGLVFDGSRLVAARSRAADIAENAGRAGAQESVALRTGDWRLDPSKATARAEQYLAAEGVSGSAQATDRTVTVSVAVDTEMTILGLIGVGSHTSRVTRTVEAVTG